MSDESTLKDRSIAVALAELREDGGWHDVQIQVTGLYWVFASAVWRCTCANKVHSYDTKLNDDSITVDFIVDGASRAGTFTYDFGFSDG
jgi:hypothetical protein